MAPDAPVLRIRSKSGCLTCRRRKKKCDEKKPTCSGCRRNALACHWPSPSAASRPLGQPGIGATSAARATSPIYDTRRTGTDLPGTDASMLEFSSFLSFQDLSALITSPPSISYGIWDHYSMGDGVEHIPSPPEELDRQYHSAGSAFSSNTQSSIVDAVNNQKATALGILDGAEFLDDTLSYSCIENDYNVIDNPHENRSQATGSQLVPAVLLPSDDLDVPRHPSFLPNFDPKSSELLSFYLSATANKMGNGSTELNPFIVNVVPMAFSEPLVLQLILAQSSVHRQVSTKRQPAKELSERYYVDSLKLFKQLAEKHRSGKETAILPLAMGSLTLSLTEIARGDTDGSTYDHIIAAKGHLRDLLLKPRHGLSNDLYDFLVEYYCHMSVLSMIGMGSRFCDDGPVDTEIMSLGRTLIEKNYVGQLVGCWLPILLLLPQIYSLGQRMSPAIQGSNPAQSPHDIITFGHLQSQILSFTPNANAPVDTALAALVFKQAALLYLWTILGMPHGSSQGTDNAHCKLIDDTANEALSLLGRISANSRINTSLCWPLSVIGCCVSDPEHEEFIRTRLMTMFDVMGLGSIRQQVALLDKAWSLPLHLRNPWSLGRVMKEHSIWISLA